MSNVVVEIQQGKLQGRENTTLTNTKYFSFKGIPYAKPPVGDLRFQAPQPPEPWEEIRDATGIFNICPQFDRATGTVVGNEDCLFLDVHTPKLPAQNTNPLPVMVFVHGGGFLFGQGTDDKHHGPDFLVEKGVIVVTFNYRLGILGFLSLNCKEAPGNMGLKDQVQALKWVKQNIAAFGGDPSNVTLFGLSAGAASVEYLLLSPMASGLFHRAIIQSGSSLNHWTHNNNIKQLAVKMAAVAGKDLKESELLTYLRELPIKDLISLTMKVLTMEKSRGGIHFGFVPTTEVSSEEWEPFLTKNTYSLLSKGLFYKVPIITGFCSHEGLLVFGMAPKLLEEVGGSEKKMAGLLPFAYNDTERAEIEDKLKKIYLDNRKSSETPEDCAIDFFTDADFFGGIFVAAKLMAKHSREIYFYEFAHDGKLNYLKTKYGMDRPGTCHGDEGGYLIKSDLLPDDVPDVDELVRKRMVQMWTNFAKLGHPTPTLDSIVPITWEPLSAPESKYLFIDKDLTMKEKPHPERTEFYEEMYKKYFKD